MLGKFFFGGPYGNEWIAGGRLLLPFAIGLLLGGIFTYLIKWLRWPPTVISVAPISMMFGVLSYVVLIASAVAEAGSFSPQAIWAGMLSALVFTWPIAFVMGPIFLIYIAQLKKGRKFLNDSTVFYLSGLCILSEFAFLYFFLDDRIS
jgi:ribose/xylose/arabinose/galactoside ABC-type transport system permease subunit